MKRSTSPLKVKIINQRIWSRCPYKNLQSNREQRGKLVVDNSINIVSAAIKNKNDNIYINRNCGKKRFKSLTSVNANQL